MSSEKIKILETDEGFFQGCRLRHEVYPGGRALGDAKERDRSYQYESGGIDSDYRLGPGR